METITRQPLPRIQGTLSDPRARVASIDALRGVIMFAMIFVNNLAGISVVPWWMQHHDPKTSGMTFVDMVFPAFLFIAGMSIPFALGSRLKRGEAIWMTLGHVVVRVISLLMIGVMMVNKPPDPTKSGWPSQMWEFLMFVSVIAAFCSIVPAWPLATDGIRRTCRYINLFIRIAGLSSLVYLALAWRGPRDERIVTFWPFFISVSWWGILGQIGWCYLMASIVFLLFRKSEVAVLGCVCLMIAMYFAGEAHLFAGFWPARYMDLGITLGTHSMLTTAGMLLGLMLVNPQMRSVAARARYTLVFVMGFAAAAILLHGQFGISKINATPSWALWGCAITASLWLVFYLVGDVLRVAALSSPLAAAGQNVLLAYVLSVMLIPTLHVTGLYAWYVHLAPNLPDAIARATATGVGLLVLTYLLNRVGFRLKL